MPTETQETWVQSLGQEDPLEEDMANYSSILAWKIPWTEEADGLQPIGLQRVGYNWAHTHIMGLSAILSRDQGGWWVPSSSLLSALLEVIAVSKKGNCGFSVLSRQGPYGIVLDSQRNLKGNFHGTWNLWCTANEGGGYPQIPARTHLGGVNLNFQMEQYIYKRKSDGQSLL